MIVIETAPAFARISAYLLQNILIIIIMILRKLLTQICQKYPTNYDVFPWFKRMILHGALVFELLVFNLANSLLWDSLTTFPSGWIIAAIITIILDKIPLSLLNHLRLLYVLNSDMMECLNLFKKREGILMHWGLFLLSCCVAGVLSVVIAYSLKWKNKLVKTIFTFSCESSNVIL